MGQTTLTLATGRMVTLAEEYDAVLAAYATGGIAARTICGRRFTTAATEIRTIEEAETPVAATTKAYGFARALR